MANRTTKVTLVAEVGNYLAGMENAARKTRELGSDAEKLAQKKEAFQTLGVAALAVGAAAAAGIGLAVAKFAEFDAAMSNVSAATQATASDLGLLREAALDAGAETIYNATESANAIEELGKAGLTTADILNGGLNGALALAASGQLEVARAAEITATTLQQFKLDGSDAGRVADVLSAGANKALGSVEDLANGLKFVGPVAQSMGISLEETTGVLASFAQAGIVGEQGGTALRGMLSSLTSPSAIARKEIERLGISLYDSSGNFLGLDNAAGQLQTAFADLTPQARDASLGILFGNEQVTAARVLYQEGAEGVSKWTADVTDSGIAARIANERLNNLQGDVEQLGGAFDTFLIQSGSGANDVLRDLVQGLTFVVDAAGDLPQPVSDAGLAIGSVAASMALAVGGALTILPKLSEVKSAMETLKLTSKATALATAGVGVALAGITIGAGLIISHFADIKAASAEVASSLDQTTGALTSYSRELVAKKLAESGAFDAAKNEGISQRELTDAVLEGGDAYDQLLKKIGARNNIVDFFNGSGIAAGNATQSIRDLRTSVEDGQKSFENQKAALEGTAEATDEQTAATEAMVTVSEDAKTAVDQLVESLKNFASGQFDMNAAQREFEQAVDDATSTLQAQKDAYQEANGSLDGFVASLDISTDAGRDNSAALDDIAKSANESAAAIYSQTGSQEQATDALSKGRDALYQQLAAYGITGAAADEYVAKVLATPESIATQVALNGVAEAEAILDNLTKNRYVLIQAAIDSGADAGAAKAAYNSTGGLIPQYLASGGSAKYMVPRGTDTVPAMLTPGEYVVNARATADNLDLLRAINSGASMGPDPRYGTPVAGVGSGTSVSQTFNIKADGPSAEVLGDSIAAKSTRRLRSRIS